MCGRIANTLPQDAMAQLFAATPANDLPQGANYNICPTDTVPVAVSENETRHLVAMRWGFIPHWYKAENAGPLLINARAETIAEKPAFKSAVRSRRCLIAATGFYEWTKDAEGKRLPWYIARKDGCPLVFAGVWQGWEKEGQVVRTCAIVTCLANDPMKAIHHRMPVILSPQDHGLWLGEQGHGAAVLMKAAPDDALVFHRVDPEVNSNRAEGPHLIEPFED